MLQDAVKPIELSFKDLIVRLKNIKENFFSGNLTVKIDAVPSWVLSFRSGRLGWVAGGIEPVNRWQRNLAIAPLDLSPDKLAEINNPQRTNLDSHTLAQLLTEGTIDRPQCAEIISGIAAECLFDIIQFSQHSGNRLTYHVNLTGADNNQLNLVLPLIEVDPILTRAIQTWQEWANAGLTAYAPSLFPIISKSNEIEQIVAAHNLQQVFTAIDGNRSLRSLASNSRQPLLQFTGALLPLLRAGFITLSLQSKSKTTPLSQERSGVTTGVTSGLTTNTLSYGNTGNSTGTNSRLTTLTTEQQSPRSSPLIACVDDSPLIYQALEKILTEHGYRSYGVQDPLKIMPSLIRNKPDFIFLDLLMPITNGYEVCEQIRKTPSLRDIPVVILTGKDGLVDRMRAKIVGATGFLGKPVNSESVLKMLEKYLIGVK